MRWSPLRCAISRGGAPSPLTMALKISLAIPVEIAPSHTMAMSDPSRSASA
eukprot:CAMPEP_0113324956 /NCGR_PEP_ID=MMETSP0010_2-20120614/17402_1 /TAXON_ID=216773 ORGANISM="Corethron hystrix, Strain 308" /NCGR_SAMPLE_ID=MMETSP0010_2 /ASSEMBLY_ACC=CAM_ASM_000155 /LENGTH=50 /DNA_ID=CAMNT_0000184531 /DNA_START=204 /DNA_END=352 /DNA_ORIENTATION=+ /assembly_acc=CAM_ASM_000155